MTLLEACRQCPTEETETDRERVRERVRAAVRFWPVVPVLTLGGCTGHKGADAVIETGALIAYQHFVWGIP